jgi:cytochrome P450
VTRVLSTSSGLSWSLATNHGSCDDHGNLRVTSEPGCSRPFKERDSRNLPSIDSEKGVSSLEADHQPYLNTVCNEVLGYYPPAPMTLRHAVSDTYIVGQEVPKGTVINVSPAATNKDLSLWSLDALKFNPDRWMAKSEGGRSNYAFMSFLHGPRSFIGQGFSKAKFACLLAAWIGRFQFELKNREDLDEKNVLVKGGIAARPPQGLWVYAKVLDDW